MFTFFKNLFKSKKQTKDNKFIDYHESDDYYPGKTDSVDDIIKTVIILNNP